MSIINPKLIKNSNTSNTKKIYWVVQCDRKAGSLSTNEFTVLHHLVLKTFCSFLSIKIRNIMIENINKKSIERSIDVIASWSSIMKYKNLAHVYAWVVNILPNVLKVK